MFRFGIIVRKDTFDIEKISHCIIVIMIVAFSQCGSFSAAGMESKQEAASFEQDIKPIFQQKCVRCHNSKNRKADFNLGSVDAILKGGESGPGIDVAHPEKSLLYEYIHEGV